MDQMKLRSILGEQVAENGTPTSQPLNDTLPFTPQNYDEDETNIDDEPPSAKLIANLKQRVIFYYCS